MTGESRLHEEHWSDHATLGLTTGPTRRTSRRLPSADLYEKMGRLVEEASKQA